MVLEQAFHSLPEILMCSRYLAQDYEAGVVAALGMATLQELNGRNISNPLSLLKLEHLYNRPAGSTRSLRCDMYLNTAPLLVANKRLAQMGWRHYNYLEGKFARKGSPPGTTIAGYLLCDLVRLCALPNTWSIDARDSFGRFLLYVYDQEPAKCVSLYRNSGVAGSPRVERTWLRPFFKAGGGPVDLTISSEVPDIRRMFPNGLDALRIECNLTTLILCPTVDDSTSALFHSYLTRINEFTLTKGADSVTLTPSRALVESTPGARDRIRQEVYANIRLPKNSKEDEPSGPEEVEADAIPEE